MKALKLFLFLLTATFCFAQEYKPTIQTEAKMNRPKYEISVFQNGKELGKIIVETFPKEAPLHSANFDSLASSGFYNGTAFHRVIPGFMIQGGDPNSKNFPNDKSKWGTGDPSQKKIPAEFNAEKPNWVHKRGILSMARTSDPNSATSQFFIMHADSPHLNGKYSIFAQVLEGIEVVDKIATAKCSGSEGSAPLETITMQIKKISK